MTELPVLQALRMRGQATPSLLADVTGLDPAELNGVLAAAVQSDLVVERGHMLRLTAAGRRRIDALLTEERNHIDLTALGARYPAFIAVNGELKKTIAAWQMRDGAPNDHHDAAYDAEVYSRLIATADKGMLIVGAVAAVASRLTRYVARLERARDRIAAHEYAFIASPMVDSYHQVWFEFHEELINLLNLSRQAEDKIESSEGPGY